MTERVLNKTKREAKAVSEDAEPQLVTEYRWHREHTALLVSILKRTVLDTGMGLCVRLGTKTFTIFGTQFGIKVLYLGRIEYLALFSCLIASTGAHLVCGVKPAGLSDPRQFQAADVDPTGPALRRYLSFLVKV